MQEKLSKELQESAGEKREKAIKSEKRQTENARDITEKAIEKCKRKTQYKTQQVLQNRIHTAHTQQKKKMENKRCEAVVKQKII